MMNLFTSVLSFSLVLVSLVSAAEVDEPGNSRSLGDDKKMVYSDIRANRLLEVMFPTAVYSCNTFRCFDNREVPPQLSNLDDVLEMNSDAVKLAKDPNRLIKQKRYGLESYWLSIYPRRVTNMSRIKDLFDMAESENLLGLVQALNSKKLLLQSPLEKALFQRDVYQIYTVFFVATEAASDLPVGLEGLVPKGKAIQLELADLLDSLRLSHEEFNKIRNSLPSTIDTTSFVLQNTMRLEDNYLPERVVRPDERWYKLNPSPDFTMHFNKFRARSFVNVYIQTPSMDAEEFANYWERLREKYGGQLTVRSGAPPLPAGSETLLLRTFGVQLKDGTFADSGFPEEVLMRIFKYESHKLDMATSDFRGTLTYQYKMDRKKLLSSVKSLGLYRIYENEPQFQGFFSEVPDNTMTMGEGIMTRRFNCISCHSGLLWGVHSVFSLALEVDTMQGRNWAGMLRPAGKDGYYHVNTTEYKHLTTLFEGHNEN